MVTFLQDFGAGGNIPPDLWYFLQGSHSGNPLAWIVDLVNDPQGCEYPWMIPPQVGPLSVGNASKSRHGGSMVISTFEIISGGSGTRRVGCICPPLPQHRHSVYRDSSNTGYMYGSRMEAGAGQKINHLRE